MQVPRHTWALFATFVFLAFTLTYFIGFAGDRLFPDATVLGYPLVAILATYGPAIAAVITALIFREDIRGFGWEPGNPRFIVLALVLPLLLYPLNYAILVFGGYLAPVPDPAQVGFPLRFAAGLAIMLVLAMGEEIGWRGFLVPQVASRTRSFLLTGLLTGIVWALWHFPFLLARNTGTVPAWFTFLDFSVGVIGSAFIYAWLRMASGSLWPCVLLHGISDWIGGILVPVVLTAGPIASAGAGYMGLMLVLDTIFPFGAAYLLYRYGTRIPAFS